MKRRHFLQTASVAAASGVVLSAQAGQPPCAPAPGVESITSKRGLTMLPDVLTVDYTFRDYEVVDYKFYTLDSMPRIRLRGPAFDPRAAARNAFFTTLGSAHALGVFSPVTYTGLLAEKIGVPGWNVGVGGISAYFYNQHPQIIEYANRGKFVILQIMSARLDGNDRLESTAAAQLVRDRKVGDIVSPEMLWARIDQEEPGNKAKYIAQSRASWERNYRELLAALKVPVVLTWFAARDIKEPFDSGRSRVNSTDPLSFPQYIDGTNVDAVKSLAEGVDVCVTARNASHPLINRFTGQPTRVNHRDLRDGRGAPVDFFEDRNNYYPSPEMHEDAATSLVPTLRRLGLA